MEYFIGGLVIMAILVYVGSQTVSGQKAVGRIKRKFDSIIK